MGPARAFIALASMGTCFAQVAQPVQSFAYGSSTWDLGSPVYGGGWGNQMKVSLDPLGPVGPNTFSDASLGCVPYEIAPVQTAFYDEPGCRPRLRPSVPHASRASRHLIPRAASCRYSYLAAPWDSAPDDGYVIGCQNDAPDWDTFHECVTLGQFEATSASSTGCGYQAFNWTNPFNFMGDE